MLGKIRRLTMLMFASTVVVALAAVGCGSDDTSDAAPTPDVAKIIQQALDSAPQGATVDQIQSMVSDSIGAAVAAMPETQPGLTRADVESIVRSASGNQLSAADVKSIVDDSIRALPAPEIDQSQLTSLIEAAVTQSVPEGVSAAEINRIVQSQVSAGLSGSLTRGDVEDLVSSAVKNAVGDQLSAADVQRVVDGALVATNAAIDGAAKQAANAAMAADTAAMSADTAAMSADTAAMSADTAADTAATAAKAADSAAMAAQSASVKADSAAMAAQSASEQAGQAISVISEVQTAVRGYIVPEQCYARGNLVSDCPAKGVSSYSAGPHTPGSPWLYHSAYDGPVPEAFFESPLSAQLVKDGTLPPLLERLPVRNDVSVVLGPDGIGEYGGAYRITEIRSYTGEWIRIRVRPARL